MYVYALMGMSIEDVSNSMSDTLPCDAKNIDLPLYEPSNFFVLYTPFKVICSDGDVRFDALNINAVSDSSGFELLFTTITYGFVLTLYDPTRTSEPSPEYITDGVPMSVLLSTGITPSEPFDVV